MLGVFRFEWLTGLGCREVLTESPLEEFPQNLCYWDSQTPTPEVCLRAAQAGAPGCLGKKLTLLLLHSKFNS